MEGTALIRVTQLPMIEERLRTVKDAVERAVMDACALACTEDTIQTVKKRRAELRKQRDALEEQRKAVKKAVLEPYERFEAVFKECISDPFEEADKELKAKIGDVEKNQKAACEKKCREYFVELCGAYGVDFVAFEQAGINITLAEAKKAIPTKLYDQLSNFVKAAADGAAQIADMDNAPEVMTEYRQCLDVGKAVATVQRRHRAMEEERQAAQRRAERNRLVVESVAKVEAAIENAAPPVAVAPEEKLFTVTFTATATREKLIALREFMKQEGIKYE